MLPPASVQAGLVSLVDIGLGPILAGGRAADAVLMDMVAAGDAVPVPGGSDDKYTRGVLGVVAGSEDYPGPASCAQAPAALAVSGWCDTPVVPSIRW